MRFTPSPDVVPPQATVLEARHIAATYTLHRIASHKNLKMILPGEHKALWSKLDDIKKASPEKAYQYVEDPFQADRDFKAKRQEIEKSKNSEKGRKATEIKSIMRSVKETISDEKSTASGAVADGTESGDKNQQPPAKRVRFNKILTMSKDGRTAVEQLIKKYHGFENTKQGTRLEESSDLYKSLYKTLVKIGFAKYQVTESLQICASLSNAIEWLLIHVPEDDLPGIFANNKYKAMSASIQSNDLKFEYAVRDIKEMGFTEDLIRSQMEAVHGNKRLAITSLTHSLCYDDSTVEDESTTNPEEALEMWKEEVSSLEAIYDPEEFKVTEDACCFVLKDFFKETKLNLTLWRTDSYPHKIPGITIEVVQMPDPASKTKKLPKYVILDLIKRTGQYAIESLTGDFMLMSLAEWLKDNFETICNNPSGLSQLAKGITGVQELIVSKKPLSATTKKQSSGRKFNRPKRNSAQMLADHKAKLENSSKLKEMIEARKALPAWKKQESIIDIIAKHQVTLVTGETGSGKSTQVAQFVVDSYINSGNGDQVDIICSQPRRISAMGLAQRVADERASDIGDEIGYVIRGESKVSNKTLLRFVTTGVLVRMIQQGPEEFTRFSHIVVDEVHERSLDSDFLLILLKRIISINKNVKIVLMSATVDPSLFINYFGGEKKVGYTHIEGRTFPVDDYYLDTILDITGYTPPALLRRDDDYYDDGVKIDKNEPIDIGRKIIAMRNAIQYDLIANLVSYIDRQLGIEKEDGSILIFMPGVAEIDRCINAIAGVSSRFYILPLHASLSPQEQRRVFPSPPAGKRKVVVSTNVAETSITIPDIVAVIDSGKVKETRYDPTTRSTQLVDCWTSLAAAKQRRGRAGRVRRGTCYKMFTATMEAKEMPERPLPEILRAPLEQLYLTVKAMGIKDTAKFLAEAIDPPETGAIEAARDTLVSVGALEKTADESTADLTPLGKHMSMIPTDLRCAKLLVLSSIFGYMDTGLTLAAILSLRSPFISNKNNRDELRQVLNEKFGAADGVGDLLVQVRAYDEYSRLRSNNKTSSSELRRWLKDNFLSRQTLQDITSARKQYVTILQEIGFISSSSRSALKNTGSGGAEKGSTAMIRAIIGASLAPSIANIVPPEKTFKSSNFGAIESENTDARSIKIFTPTERLFVHPASLLFGATTFIPRGERTDNEYGEYLAYARKMQTTKTFIDGLTPVNVYGLLFFASGGITVDPLGTGVVVDEWLGLKCWPRIGILVKLLRGLFDRVVEDRLANPVDTDKHEVLQLIENLIQVNGLLK